MSFKELAGLGGPKTIVGELETYRSIGIEELLAATKVIKSGILSEY